MAEIAPALAAALRDLFTRRMLGLVLWPLIGALLAWTVIGWIGWSHWLALFEQLLGGPSGWLGPHLAAALGGVLAFAVLLPLLLILAVVTALVVTSWLAVPAMLDTVGSRRFPQLERKRGGTVWGSLANAGLVLAVYLVLLVLSLPLWLLVPFGFYLFPLLLGGWLNARLFRYDVLAEHASRDEYRELIRRERGRLLGLGIVLAALQSIPGLNLLAPLFAVYSALAFVHYLLARLAALRAVSEVPTGAR